MAQGRAFKVRPGCPECGKPMEISRRGEGFEVWRCRPCRKVRTVRWMHTSYSRRYRLQQLERVQVEAKDTIGEISVTEHLNRLRGDAA